MTEYTFTLYRIVDMSIYQPVELFSIVYATTYILTDINTFIHVDNYISRHVDN